MKKLARFFIGVKSEMKKVKWPDKKDMIKYSVATISFILVFICFFSLTDITLTWLKMLVK